MSINNYPCIGCKYFNSCGDYLRRESCAGREAAPESNEIKSREEIRKIINEINAAADEAKSEKDAIKEDKRDFFRAYREKDEAALTRLNEADRQIALSSEAVYILNILRKIWQHNYRIALFTEAIQIITEVLTKYKGKPCGEKTRRKIYEEVKAASGIYFYFDRDYSGRAHWCVSDNYMNLYNSAGDITAWSEEDKRQIDLLPDNKIIIPDADALSYYYRDYITNPAGRVADLIEAHKKAQEAQEECRKACSDFNALAPYNMDTLYYSKNIYHTIDGC